MALAKLQNAERTDQLTLAGTALDHVKTYVEQVQSVVQTRVVSEGRVKSSKVNLEQRAVHGYAWIETTYMALQSVLDWAKSRAARSALSEADQLALDIAFGEYLVQIGTGIPMGQNEFIRPADLGLSEAARTFLDQPAIRSLIETGNTPEKRARLAKLMADGQGISDDFNDETLDAVKDQYRRFTQDRIIPHAHQWHLDNALIPDEIVKEMADLGTFGVCIPEAHDGLGLGKLVMCIVTEELSRGWIGAGSLGTRSEIAGELILLGGTEAQKEKWLPAIARGDILPTAVFTEPDTGSDLGSLKTRATQNADGSWTLTGAKTWITHAARSDVMTLLARTRPEIDGYAGLSMLLVPKPRGTENDPFPVEGLTGTEIEVLGYRGMREYELGFDDFQAPDDALLGGEEGRGFKQLMATFEGARIQTAARAVGVAVRALELGLKYAIERQQFGQSILNFPRVSDKIAMMAVDVLMSREITYFSAREKDKGLRCDIEAGMAKLFAARTAWSNADASLQIHGGNGYALEYEISRVLCDARILNIFEGAGEIQAQVVAKGKLIRSLS